MIPEESERQSESGWNARNFAAWIFLSIVAVGVLQLVATHAPAKAKLLGLYFVGCGLLSGIAIGQLATVHGIVMRGAALFVALTIVLLGLIGQTVESHRLYVQKLEQAYRDDPIKEIVSKLPPATNAAERGQHAELISQLEQDRQQTLSFSYYLQRRCSALGTWPFPWPEVFWCLEMVAGTVAGFVGLRWAMRPVRDNE